MLIQFYKRTNFIRVFGGENHTRFLLDIPNATQLSANIYFGFKSKASDWTKTEWGSEIELDLIPKAKSKRLHSE